MGERPPRARRVGRRADKRRRTPSGQKAPHLPAHPAVTLHARRRPDVRVPGRSVLARHPCGDGFSVHAARTATGCGCSTRSWTARAGRWSLRGAAGARRFLLTSSGAVYGRQPAETDASFPRTTPAGPDPADARAAYAEGKRAAEMLCALYADARLQPTIARCFAFVGPVPAARRAFRGRQLHSRRAAGGPIRVAGDGTPYRLVSCTPRTWRSGCGRFCCAGSRCAPTTSGRRRADDPGLAGDWSRSSDLARPSRCAPSLGMPASGTCRMSPREPSSDCGHGVAGGAIRRTVAVALDVRSQRRSPAELRRWYD